MAHTILKSTCPIPSVSAITDIPQLGYTADLLFPSACSLTKISLCLTYYRLFPSRTDKIFCWVMGTFVTSYTITCFFLSMFQCRPIRAYWDTDVTPVCINMRATLVVIAGLNTFSDFMIYLFGSLASIHNIASSD